MLTRGEEDRMSDFWINNLGQPCQVRNNYRSSNTIKLEEMILRYLKKNTQVKISKTLPFRPDFTSQQCLISVHKYKQKG